MRLAPPGTLRASLLIVLAVGVASTSVAQTPPIFVDSDAPGPFRNGSTWENAYHDLQPAIDEAALTGRRVLVAEGLYRPTAYFEPLNAPSTDLRARAFRIQDTMVPPTVTMQSVRIHGGFLGFVSGTQTSDDWETPDGKFKNTVLEGLTGTGSVWHVIGIDGTGTDNLPPEIRFDGFKIQNGLAQSTTPLDPVHAIHGAGIYIDLDDEVGTNVWLENLIVKDNKAVGEGGGLRCTSRTRAFAATGKIRVRHCTFSENIAAIGAGMSVTSGALLIGSSRLFDNGSIDPVFPDNVVTDRGGAFGLGAEAEIRAVNVLVYDNEARSGGAVHWKPATTLVDSKHEWRNCTITDNRCEAGTGTCAGGLMFEGGRTTLTDPTTQEWSVMVEIWNSIVWGNDGIDVLGVKVDSADTGVFFRSKYCDVGTTSTAPGLVAFDINPMFNISVNPTFVDPSSSNYNLRFDANYPTKTSECIDAGVDDEIGEDIVDLDDDLDSLEDVPNDIRRVDLRRQPPQSPITGVIRIIDRFTIMAPSFGETVDMGAFEQADGLIVVQ